MRVTEAMRAAHAVEATQAQSARMMRASQEASSGLRVGAPSDDPTSWSEGQRLGSRVSLLAARSKTAGIASGDLQLAESVLASGSDLIVRARELAVQLSNGSIDAASRANAAQEIDSIRQQLMAIGNTKGAAGYIFAGNQTSTLPFDANGNYQGDQGSRQVEIADGKTVSASASGALAFTAAGGRDILADLAAFSVALKNNNVGQIQTAIDRMDQAQAQLVAARVRAGLDADRLRAASTVMTAASAQLTQSQSGAVDADAAATFSELAQARSAYERAIEVTKQILAQSMQR